MQPAKINRPIVTPNSWDDLPQGRWVSQEFQAFVTRECPKMFGYHLLKVGTLSATLDCQTSPIRYHTALSPKAEHADIIGHAENIPIRAACIDLCILAHTLDFSADPHQILREVDRVLTADGWVILCGFNSMSLVGLRRLIPSQRQALPWSANMFFPERVCDWLQLLGFEILSQDFCGFSYLGKNSTVSLWREDFCYKYLRHFASIYMVSARKRRIPLTPSRSNWRLKPRPLTEPGIARFEP